MTKLPVNTLPAKTRKIDLSAGTSVHHLPDWGSYDDPKKLEVLRKIAEMRGRDPRIASLAVSIIKKAKVKPREYKKQAACLLKWVQSPKNVYYINEPGERLQDPIFTIKNGYGDCDDQIMVLCSLFESVKLPWKLVISGRSKVTKRKVRYVEGDGYPPDCEWTHIYCMVGTPPFTPNEWYFCECTVEGVPLGWDVVDGDHSFLPEMVKHKNGPSRMMDVGVTAPFNFKPIRPPKGKVLSPAYAEAAYGDAVSSSMASSLSSAVGASVATEMMADDEQAATGTVKNNNWLDFAKISQAVVTGITITVVTQIALDVIRSTGLWKSLTKGLNR